MMRLSTFTCAVMIAAACSAAHGQEVKALPSMTLHDFAAKWMMQQDDIADAARYRDENRAVALPRRGVARIVLFGDSLTFHWPSDLLPNAPTREFINRGIAGQNSSQLVLRFQSDVVQLAPQAVVILVGTNDLRVYQGDPAAARATVIDRLLRNLNALIDMAEAHGIAPVLCTIPAFGSSPSLQRDLVTLSAANDAIKKLAAERRLAVANYHDALPMVDGYLSRDFAKDGLHFGPEGYKSLEHVLDQALVSVDRKRLR